MKAHPRSTWKDDLSGMGMAGVWLVFLAYPVSELLQMPARSQAIGFSLMAIFVVCYLAMLRDLGIFVDVSERPRQLALFATLVAITLASAAALGTTAMGYVPFLVAAASWGLWSPLNRIAGVATLAIAAGVGLWNDDSSKIGVLLAGLIILAVAWLTIASIERSQQETALRQELALVEERNRIASDVHDLLGHSLTVVNLKLQLISRLVDADPARARSELAETREIVTEALGNVRRTVSMERSTSLADELTQARAALAAGGVEVTVDGDADRVTGPIALVLGWVVREASTNVLRHAHASRCVVTIESGRLTVADDGDGRLDRKDGNGIRGMRERVAAAGGALVVDESELGGTKVEATW